MSESEQRDTGCAAWRDAAAACGLGVAAVLLYLRTLCPTVYVGDSGEIAGAISVGGIIHPPGYPLFSLLGRASLALIPYGEAAFRIGCLVALSAGLAVAVLFLLMRQAGLSRWASVLGAGGFSVSYTFWSQSTRVEVYSLHVLLAALTLLFALRYREQREVRDLFLASLWGSLGLAHHLTIVLLGPALLLLFGKQFWTDRGLPRRLLAVLPTLLIGPLLYLVLIYWARQEPLQAWGSPRNLSLLWNHASGRVYQSALHLPNAAYAAIRLRETWRLLITNYPLGTWLLLPIGAVALGRRNPVVTGGLLAAIATVTAYNFCYHIGDIAPYYLTALLTGFVLLAAGLERLAVRARTLSAAALPAVGAVGTAMLLAAPLLQNWAVCDLSRATWVREFAANKLRSCADHSVLIMQGDDDGFPLWYVHQSLHVRPDITVVDRLLCRGTWVHYPRDPSLWYIHSLRAAGVNASTAVPADSAERARLAGDGYLHELLKGPLRGRPLALTFFDSAQQSGRPIMRWANEHYQSLPVGLVVRLQPKGRPVDVAGLIRESQQIWDQVQLPDRASIRVDEELSPEYMTNHYACMLVNLGGLYEMQGNRRQAEAAYRRAAEWAPDYRPAIAALAALQHTGVASIQQ